MLPFRVNLDDYRVGFGEEPAADQAPTLAAEARNACKGLSTAGENGSWGGI
jgi:hypothetical protein